MSASAPRSGRRRRGSHWCCTTERSAWEAASSADIRACDRPERYIDTAPHGRHGAIPQQFSLALGRSRLERRAPGQLLGVSREIRVLRPPGEVAKPELEIAER